MKHVRPARKLSLACPFSGNYQKCAMLPVLFESHQELLKRPKSLLLCHAVEVQRRINIPATPPDMTCLSRITCMLLLSLQACRGAGQCPSAAAALYAQRQHFCASPCTPRLVTLAVMTIFFRTLPSRIRQVTSCGAASVSHPVSPVDQRSCSSRVQTTSGHRALLQIWRATRIWYQHIEIGQDPVQASLPPRQLPCHCPHKYRHAQVRLNSTASILCNHQSLKACRFLHPLPDRSIQTGSPHGVISPVYCQRPAIGQLHPLRPRADPMQDSGRLSSFAEKHVRSALLVAAVQPPSLPGWQLPTSHRSPAWTYLPGQFLLTGSRGHQSPCIHGRFVQHIRYVTQHIAIKQAICPIPCICRNRRSFGFIQASISASRPFYRNVRMICIGVATGHYCTVTGNTTSGEVFPESDPRSTITRSSGRARTGTEKASLYAVHRCKISRFKVPGKPSLCSLACALLPVSSVAGLPNISSGVKFCLKK